MDTTKIPLIILHSISDNVADEACNYFPISIPFTPTYDVDCKRVYYSSRDMRQMKLKTLVPWSV